MDNCMSCAHSVFNEIWGEYRCEVKQITIYNPNEVKCSDHKKRQEGKTSHDSSG